MTEQWQELKETITEMRDNGGTGTQQDVCKFLANYMETLEKQMQQPSEDCISRVEAIDKLTKLYNMVLDDINIRDIAGTLERLPSVTPRTNLAETSQDCINRQAVIDHICEDKECYTEECKGRTLKRCPDLQWVLDLPSVTPQRPKGKWIEVLEHKDENSSTWHYECSECRARSYKGFEPLEKYCHNCGSYNGGEEDADSN